MEVDEFDILLCVESDDASERNSDLLAFLCQGVDGAVVYDVEKLLNAKSERC
ncbi:hypothetical protein SDJN02_07450, partial [Cucurbita argyrosperma subsp. argyrosperma]